MSMTFSLEATPGRRAALAAKAARAPFDRATLVTIALFCLIFAASLFFAFAQPQLSPADGIAFVTGL